MGTYFLLRSVRVGGFPSANLMEASTSASPLRRFFRRGRIRRLIGFLALLWLVCVVVGTLLKFLSQLLQLILGEQEQLIRIDAFLS